MKISGNNPCLGTRAALSDGSAGPYVWQTYNQVNTRLTNFGSGLVGLGLATVRAWCLLTNPGNPCMTRVYLRATGCLRWTVFPEQGRVGHRGAGLLRVLSGVCPAVRHPRYVCCRAYGHASLYLMGLCGVCRTGRGVLHHQPDRDDHHCGGRGQAFDRTLAWTSKAVGVPGSPRDICMYVCSHAAPRVCG